MQRIEGDLRDFGRALAGAAQPAPHEAAARIVTAIVDAANGKETKAEILKHWEVAIPIRGVTY